MTLKLKSEYFKFNPNTLEDVRKEYNLNKPGAMDRVIDSLDHWVHRQDHFVKKDLDREYLERFIISSKGSVERAKTRIDRLFTMRTMVPNLFGGCNAKKDFPKLREFFFNLLMPEISEDNYRIHIGKMISKNITPSACLESYQHAGIIFEYGKLYDYVKGYHIVYDLSDVNIMDLIAKIDMIDFRNMLTLIIEAYGFRIASIYIVSSSTMIHAFVNILKQFLSEKIGQRIHVLKTLESVQEFLPKKMLPKDFGGEQKSVLELYDEMNEELSSAKHVAHMERMRQAYTNEELRRSERFNQEYLGMPGSFKMLSVD